MSSKAKTVAGDKRGNVIRIAILVGAVVLVLGVAGYRLYQTTRLQSHFQEMEQIQKEASEKLAPLSDYFDQFQAHPDLAEKMKPKFKEGQNILEEAAIKLKATRPPKKLTKLKRDLISLDMKSAGIYKDLTKFADYLVEREKIIDDFIKATEDFDKAAKEAKTNEDIIKAGGALKKSADETVKKLEKLDSPIKVYSNQLLSDNLKKLSQSFSLLEEGINQNDVAKVEQAGSQLGEVFSEDWTDAVFQEDKKDIEEYDARVKGINKLYKQVQQDMIEYSK